VGNKELLEKKIHRLSIYLFKLCLINILK
jgi:hypothetical protein